MKPNTPPRQVRIASTAPKGQNAGTHIRPRQTIKM